MISRVYRPLLIVLCFFLIRYPFADAYDPMDPNGNITIKWDFQQWRDDGYMVFVNIYNYQLYRHVETPGWKLGWTWKEDEVIWDMRGAEAIEQGNCSKFKGGNLPHCCEKKPVIVDLLPGAPYNTQTSNCCRGGVVSSMIQDPSKYSSSFQMSVGYFNATNFTAAMPENFSLGLPGYTCSDVYKVEPSKFSSDHSRRTTQALLTWQVTCSFSQFRESNLPTCCVALSTFYSDTVVSCPHCSCGCRDAPSSTKCVRGDEPQPFLQLPQGEELTPPIVMCTDHMCPIRVHWHLKVSYKEYWRVKVTITNFNILKNYSEWNLVVQHPNLESLTQVFSFNYKPLLQYGDTNDTGMFWGIQYYNDLLLQNGEDGNVQSEMLLHKDPGIFTFKGGWAFPRRISFNGYECVMPSPDMYPPLPSGSHAPASVHHLSLGLSALSLFVVLLLV